MLPRGVSRSPQTPKWSQNGTKNGATTHMIERSAVPLISSEMREKLAYPQSSPEGRKAGAPSEQQRGERSSNTLRAAPQLYHAPASHGQMSEAHLNYTGGDRSTAVWLRGKLH